jgi:TlyA family rRNA methyltransferase/putative hemolysin
VGLASGDEVAGLLDRVRALEAEVRQLRAASPAASSSPAAAPSKAAPAKKGASHRTSASKATAGTTTATTPTSTSTSQAPATSPAKKASPRKAAATKTRPRRPRPRRPRPRRPGQEDPGQEDPGRRRTGEDVTREEDAPCVEEQLMTAPDVAPARRLVEQAVAALATTDELPVSEHVAVLDGVHRALQDALAPSTRSELVRRARLDAELVRRGLARSREQAAALVAEGLVTVAGATATKPATAVEPGTPLVVREPEGRSWVSRGGHKLDGALDAFGYDPAGKRALDAGASTGGFTDVLLQRGAAHVVAVDVGYGQLAWSLQSDPRVSVVDRTNVRSLTLEQVGEPVDLVVADLSFIPLGLVLPALVACTTPGADLLPWSSRSSRWARAPAQRRRGAATLRLVPTQSAPSPSAAALSWGVAVCEPPGRCRSERAVEYFVAGRGRRMDDDCAAGGDRGGRSEAGVWSAAKQRRRDLEGESAARDRSVLVLAHPGARPPARRGGTAVARLQAAGRRCASSPTRRATWPVRGARVRRRHRRRRRRRAGAWCSAATAASCGRPSSLGSRRCRCSASTSGRVGFLAEAEQEDLEETLERVLERDYTVEPRSTLDVDVLVEGRRRRHRLGAQRVQRREGGPRADARGGRSRSTAGPCRDGAATASWPRRPTGSTAYAFSRAARWSGRRSRRC